jgi:hypothetical protein
MGVAVTRTVAVTIAVAVAVVIAVAVAVGMGCGVNNSRAAYISWSLPRTSTHDPHVTPGPDDSPM